MPPALKSAPGRILFRRISSKRSTVSCEWSGARERDVNTVEKRDRSHIVRYMKCPLASRKHDSRFLTPHLPTRILRSLANLKSQAKSQIHLNTHEIPVSNLLS